MKTILAVLLALGAGSVPAWAALGSDASSISADRSFLRGARSKVGLPGYELDQITTPDGSVVREYVSPQGKVFGVSWQGHSLPNLQQLLGAYSAELERGQRTRVITRRAVVVQSNDFVFFSMGHARFFRGRAYVPSLVPNNITAEVVR